MALAAERSSSSNRDATLYRWTRGEPQRCLRHPIAIEQALGVQYRAPS